MSDKPDASFIAFVFYG